MSVAVDGALFGTFFFAGQACESGTRCFVPASIYDEFMERARDRVKHVTVGDPADFETALGPLASKAQLTRVLGYIETGRKEGARLVCGGGRPPGMKKGWYVQPTIFDQVPNSATDRAGGDLRPRAHRDPLRKHR